MFLPPSPPTPQKMIFGINFQYWNKVWGLHGKTGLFAHTDVPVMHRITSKVTINTFNIFEILVILPQKIALLPFNTCVLNTLLIQVNVIDFPGSNSLDYHAKTFSICGAMNNLIIVILPFTGDVSALVSEEVAKVFQVICLLI